MHYHNNNVGKNELDLNEDLIGTSERRSRMMLSLNDNNNNNCCDMDYHNNQFDNYNYENKNEDKNEYENNDMNKKELFVNSIDKNKSNISNSTKCTIYYNPQPSTFKFFTYIIICCVITCSGFQRFQ